MFRRPRNLALILCFMALSSFQLAAQEDSGWRISPEDINITMGQDRPLQLLDDSAQELHGAVWSVDNPELAEIEQDGGRVVLHPKAVGTVRVSAALGGEERFREIKIWPPFQPLPLGTSKWSTHAIGHEIGDLPAVPTDDGPNLFSLEQTASGSTYLRAISDDGIQVWTWLMPEKTQDVELICGDWLGGAEVSAKHSNSYTLYAVGKDGKLRWQYTAPGLRKGLTISTEHLVQLLDQSPDGAVTSIAVLDELSGVKKFELLLPASSEIQVNVRREGTKFLCASGSVSRPSRTFVSHLMVNMDGYAYIAFTQNARTLGIANCTPGSTVDPDQMYLARDDNLMLWQIHADGTYRSIIVEATKDKQPFSALFNTVSPTGAILTDNMNGTLIPVELSQYTGLEKASESADDFVYRVDQDGKLVYKLPLPGYTGPLHDDTVIGSDNLAFATRGGVLIAFDQTIGKELWLWDSNTPEIEVFAALANGDCLVQTPNALVEVKSSTESKELLKGKAMLNWQGQIFVKND